VEIAVNKEKIGKDSEGTEIKDRMRKEMCERAMQHMTFKESRLANHTHTNTTTVFNFRKSFRVAESADEAWHKVGGGPMQ
jgi:hypothetical protein